MSDISSVFAVGGEGGGGTNDWCIAFVNSLDPDRGRHNPGTLLF